MPIRPVLAAIFWVLLAAWTWKLVEPAPFPKTAASLGEWKLAAAKTLHGTAYAVLAVLGYLWPAARRGRAAVLGLLLAHAVGTEIAQTYVPGRSGKVTDVLIDWAGIAVGLTFVRYFVRYRYIFGPIIPTARAGWSNNSDRAGCDVRDG